MTSHGASCGGDGPGNIASTMLLLLLVDGGPVVLRAVCRWKEGSNLRLDLCLLKQQLLKFVTAGGGIHCHIEGPIGMGRCSLEQNNCACNLLEDLEGLVKLQRLQPCFVQSVRRSAKANGAKRRADGGEKRK